MAKPIQPTISLSPITALYILFIASFGSLILFVVYRGSRGQDDLLHEIILKETKPKKKKNVSLLDDLGISSSAISSKTAVPGADQDQARQDTPQSLKNRKGWKKKGGSTDADSPDEDLFDTTSHSHRAGKGYDPSSTAADNGNTAIVTPILSAISSSESSKIEENDEVNRVASSKPPPSPNRIPSHSTISICTLSDSSNGGNSSGNDTSTARADHNKSAAPESFEDGWQVVNKRNSAKSINVSKNNSYSSLKSLASNASSSGLAKKQRENAKKYAKEKERKALDSQEQDRRLKAHRIEQEKLAISRTK